MKTYEIKKAIALALERALMEKFEIFSSPKGLFGIRYNSKDETVSLERGGEIAKISATLKKGFVLKVLYVAYANYQPFSC